MALSVGSRIGPYEILAPIGAGGMGEVYKARDTRLERIVAVKVLPAHVSSNPDLRARFEREARALSGFQHPHICSLYDVGREGSLDFLVMEYLEGESMASRIEKGSLPLEQALSYGAQIADALDTAHRSGIVHRDLKPGNVMLTSTGAKLLDFGLAKPATSLQQMAQATVTATRTTPLTGEGTVVGTFQYMSPEQVEGRVVDGRSDIFSLGAVLYEMLTGRRAFPGTSGLSVASAILEKEPVSIAILRPMTPAALERLVRICLAKDPNRRWSSAHDIALQLQLLGESAEDTITAAAPRPARRTAVAIALAALLTGGILAGLAARWIRPAPEVRSVLRFTIPFPKDTPMELPHPSPRLAIAPDGSAIAYVSALRSWDQVASSATSGDDLWLSTRVTEGFLSGGAEAVTALYVRHLDQPAPERVPGGDDAIDPFFSPDSLWLGWISHGLMKKVLLGGGAPVTICEVATNYVGGADWAPDGFIYFAPGELMRVSASGGTPESVVAVDTTKNVDYQSPQVLPGGRAVLLTRKPVNITRYDDAVIFAYRLDTKESVTLVEGGTAGLYLPSGHLLYARGGSIFAVPFDAANLKVLGAPVEVLRGGMLSEAAGFAALVVSANGVLAYAAGGPMQIDNVELIAVSRTGAVKVLSPTPRSFADPAVSPDGQDLAVTLHAANDDIWLFNRTRGALSRFTFAGGDNQVPIWSGDGSHVIYSRTTNNLRNLFWRKVDGGPEERLTSGDIVQFPDATTPDGKLLAFTQWTGANADIDVLPLDGAHTPRPLIATRFNEQGATFSPDGRWLAFTSDESDRNEVYIQPFGREGARTMVSTGGGNHPMWDQDGKRLYYAMGNSFMQTAFDSSRGITGSPTVLFSLPPHTAVLAVTAAGEFIGVRKLSESTTVPELQVATEWLRELSARVPVPR
jgi:hypothetical protein